MEADLGRFSEAIYKRVITAAKNERFQGFRPGTIPPHLEPTYRAFAMDECARETVLEAMQQNNIKPFETARSDFFLEQFQIPPPSTNNKKKTSKKKIKKSTDTASVDGSEEQASVSEEEPKWRTFATMKEAIDAGWKVSTSDCRLPVTLCLFVSPAYKRVFRFFLVFRHTFGYSPDKALVLLPKR